MGSPFDNLQNLIFDTTKDLFGFECSWTAQDGGASYTGKVHFKNPTQKLKDIGVEFDPTNWEMEYRFGDFDGLQERVEARNSKEKVTVDGVEYYVINIDTDWDGKTYTAKLKPFED